MGTPAFSIYSASKAAVRNLARSWAQDLRGTGIRINVLPPRPTFTELAAEIVGRDAMIEMGSSTPTGQSATRPKSWQPRHSSHRRKAAS